MSVAIGSNISSLRAQRELARGTQTLSRVFERLASGQRINRASDDAAGLSIASSLKADIRVFSQGIRNFNDGLSTLNIMQGAMSELAKVTIRQKELVEQAANGTYSNVQRRELDREAQALKSEFERIISSTKFNGVQLFSEENSTMRLQGGYGLEESLVVTISNPPTEVPDGTFTSHSVAATAGLPAVADINHDGHLDIVGASGNNSRMVTSLGNGDGTFQAIVETQLTGTIAAFRDTIVEDIDGDGDYDAIFNDFDSNIVRVALGNADGTFGIGPTYSVPNNTRGMKGVDVNGDGNLDIVTSHTGGQINVLLGSANGTFITNGAYNAGSGVLGLTTGDFDNDGDVDVITSGFVSPAVFFRNDGTGAYTATTFGSNELSVRLYSADINNDHNLDVALQALDGTLDFYLGNGNGTFQARTQVAMSGTTGGDFLLADFNADGNIDIFSTETAATSAVRLGNGNGTFGALTTYSGGSVTLALGDFNEDSVTDVFGGAGPFAYLWTANTATQTIGQIRPSDISLLTQSSARDAFEALDTQLRLTNYVLGSIGQAQSRIDVAVRNLTTRGENYHAAHSRIMDADFAAETSISIRTTILQQAAASVLAQANQLPTLALTLLREV